jgi:chromosomal replication initiation ATPase DnaA
MIKDSINLEDFKLSFGHIADEIVDNLNVYKLVVFKGGPGVGKTTHLKGMKKLIKKTKARYATYIDFGSDFTAYLIDDIQAKRADEFIHNAINTNYLFIDDCHLFKNKTTTTMKFTEILKARIALNYSTFLTMSHDFSFENEELRCLLKSALTIDVKLPSQSELVAVGASFAGSIGLELEDGVVSYLASKTNFGHYELEGLLLKVKALSASLGHKPTLNLVRDWVR